MAWRTQQMLSLSLPPSFPLHMSLTHVPAMLCPFLLHVYVMHSSCLHEQVGTIAVKRSHTKQWFTIDQRGCLLAWP
jgi:hypothetical protein